MKREIEPAPTTTSDLDVIVLGEARSDTLGKSGPIMEFVRDWNGDGISDD